jgi:DNA-binding protein YbaB
MKMPELQERLAASQYVAEAGGAVKATVNGKGELVDIKIDPAGLVGLTDQTGMLEDNIKAAVSAAQAAATQAAAEGMKEITGGLDLAGLEGLMH